MFTTYIPRRFSSECKETNSFLSVTSQTCNCFRMDGFRALNLVTGLMRCLAVWH